MTTATPARAGPNVDAGEIADAARLFMRTPEQVTELRIIDYQERPTWTRNFSGYFDDPDALGNEAVKYTRDAVGVYLIPNAVKSAMLFRRKNSVGVAKQGQSTGDSQIERRLWLLVDCDPVRPGGVTDIPSNDDEHEAALDKAREIRDWLGADGWPDPIFADSGNGSHLAYAVELPADDGGLCQRALQALAFVFTDEVVTIDTTTFNASRLWKLPGTLSRKGDNNPERPHRKAHVIESPEDICPVPRDVLEALVEKCVPEDAEQEQQQKQAHRNNGHAAFDLQTWINKHVPAELGIRAPLKLSYGLMWVFARCPWDQDHAGTARILQRESGAVVARCHHYSCGGKGRNRWHDLRDLWEKGWRAKTADRTYRRNSSHSSQQDDEPLRPIRRRMSDVSPSRVHWLWPSHIPLRAVSLLAGKMGEGKSIITAGLVSVVTTGGGWPDEPKGRQEPANVVLVLAEDDLETVVRPRLDAAGADAERIEVLTMMQSPDGEREYLFNVKRDAPALREMVQDIGNVRMIIIDPIGTFMGKADTHKHSDTYGALAPLAKLAQDEDCAVVGVHHHNKTAEADALARVMGSSAFTAIARAVFSVYPDPDGDTGNDRLLACAKLNFCQKPPALRYKIISAADGTGVASFDPEPVDMDANAIIGRLTRQGRGDGDKSATEQAMDWLENELQAGPQPSKGLAGKAEAVGISSRTLDRAKGRLKVNAYPDREDGRMKGWMVSLRHDHHTRKEEK